MCRIIILCVLLLSGRAQAGVILTMTPSPGDLSNLSIGDSVDITVALSGLGSLELSALGGTIEFPAVIFTIPTSSVAGSIVPVASDLTLTPMTGALDGQFFAITGGNIVAEGDFFRFKLKAIAAGSGVIQFDPLSLFYQDGAGAPFFDVQTNELAFNVQGNVVPEPGAALVWLLLISAILSHRQCRAFIRPMCARGL